MDKEELVYVCIHIYDIYYYTPYIYVYTWNIIQPESSESCHLQNMDRPWGHYAKWEADKGNTIDTISHMWKSEKSETHKSRELNGDYQLGDKGKVMMFVKQYKLQYSEDNWLWRANVP